MLPNGDRANKELNAKVYEIRYPKAEKFKEGLQEERASSPRCRISSVTRLRRAKSLGNIRYLARTLDRRPATTEAHRKKDDARCWPRNAPAVAVAVPILVIPEIPSALEPPPGVPSRPDLTQELFANRARVFADGI